MAKSPRQEASDSCSGSDKSDSVECPTCGDTFCSTQYMKSHHTQVHGESIAGELVECAWCGDEFRVQPSNIREKNYCSNKCFRKGRSERYSGENHPRYNGGEIEVNCEQCGKGYNIPPAKKDKSRFCSRECLNQWRSENETGENHPQYDRIECECKMCSETVHRQPSQLERMDNVFCSQECHREYQSIHQRGENHHHYKPESIDDYGPNWHRQRRKALERDNHKCQFCGLPESEHHQGLSVHHITPREAFMQDGEFDYEQANKLDNLLSLCQACHRKVEQWGLLPDKR